MTYAKKTLSEIKLIYGPFGNYIGGQKNNKDKKDKPLKSVPYKDLTSSNELEGEPIDEKCWPGYEKKGNICSNICNPSSCNFTRIFNSNPKL